MRFSILFPRRTDRAQGAQLFDAEGPLQFFTASDLEELTDVFQFEAHTYELHSLNEETGTGVALEHSKEEILIGSTAEFGASAGSCFISLSIWAL